jgi:hypothetical protein
MTSADRQRKATGHHRAAVDKLASDLGLPAEQVEGVYLSEMARIESGARIKTFLTVLTVGSVRSRLHRHGHTGH